MKHLNDLGGGLHTFLPTKHYDRRGHISETYKYDEILTYYSDTRFTHEIETISHYGVMRGLHYQRSPSQQIKLIRVIHGVIIDCLIDIRPHSPTFKKKYSIELSSDNEIQLLIPAGFAHGFLTLSNKSIVRYKIAGQRVVDSEAGLFFDADNFSLPVSNREAIKSHRDCMLPRIEEVFFGNKPTAETEPVS
jgi:dTDP-4-dehydrorhamnose 3,5-epimerase